MWVFFIPTQENKESGDENNTTNYAMEVLDPKNYLWIEIFKLSVATIFLYLLLRSYLFFLLFFSFTFHSFTSCTLLIFHIFSPCIYFLFFSSVFCLFYLSFASCFYFFYNSLRVYDLITENKLQKDPPPSWYGPNSVRATVSHKPFTSRNLTNSTTPDPLMYRLALSLPLH